MQTKLKNKIDVPRNARSLNYIDQSPVLSEIDEKILLEAIQ